MIPGCGFMVFNGHLLDSYLFLAVADSFTLQTYNWADAEDVLLPTWSENFSEYSESGLFSYIWNSNAIADTGLLATKTIPINGISELFIRAYNKSGPGDLCEAIYEFLDEADDVVAVIKTAADGGYSSGLWFGSSIASLTKAGKTGYGHTNGVIGFSPSEIVYTRSPSSIDSNGYNDDFAFSCAAQSIVSVRVSTARATSTFTGGSGAALASLRHNR